MPEEHTNCPRCSRIVGSGTAVCEWCGLDLAAGSQANPISSPGFSPQPALSIVCTNCRAVLPPATRICPTCGHELYMAGYSPVGSWPPVAGGRDPGSPPLMTRSPRGDIATGAFWGLLAGVAALFTSGISLVILWAVCREAFCKYPYYRRGIFYGGAAAALVLMSAFVACFYVVRFVR